METEWWREKTAHCSIWRMQIVYLIILDSTEQIKSDSMNSCLFSTIQFEHEYPGYIYKSQTSLTIDVWFDNNELWQW